jgi:hypothetical protein
MVRWIELEAKAAYEKGMEKLRVEIERILSPEVDPSAIAIKARQAGLSEKLREVEALRAARLPPLIQLFNGCTVPEIVRSTNEWEARARAIMEGK